MAERNPIVPKRGPDLSEPDHVRFEPKVRKRVLEIAEETGQGFAACVRHLVGAGLEAYDKEQSK